MSAFVRPFAALRPDAEHAAAVVAPPYDVVSADEARELVVGRPNSFLHISRPEIEFPPETDPYSDEVYERARENLERLKALGLLIRDSAPAYYIYELRMGAHEQTGVALTVSVDAYQANRVRKHELTRPTKEDDRVRNMLSLNAQTGPVLSAHRADRSMKKLLAQLKAEPALFEVKGQHDVLHTIWRVDEAERISAISAAFEDMQAIYIADGHHRSAAAARVANERRDPQRPTTQSHDYFLTVVFPHDEMQIFDYNRVVRDLNGLSIAELLQGLAEDFDVDATDGAVTPPGRATFGMFVGDQWYRLELREELIPTSDPRSHAST